MGVASRGDGGDEVIVYPFYREGRIVDRKYRPLVRQEGKPRFWRDKGGTICAFNEDCLRDDSLRSFPLIITEGQDDCIATVQAGYLRCISVPDGAPEKPIQDLEASKKYEWLDQIAPLLSLERCPEIILAVDGDDAGAALLHDLSAKLGRARCKFLAYPKAPPEMAKSLGRERLKDMNETLQAYGQKGVAACIAKASFLKVDGVYAMSELPPLPPSVIYDIGFEAFSEHYKMRLGDMAVVTGVPGHGKSTWMNDAVCRVIKRYGVRAAWASFEQAPQRDHRRALRSWFCEGPENVLNEREIAAADRWIDDFHRFIVPSEDDDVTLSWVFEKMEAAVIQHGCRIIVLDPWNEMDHDRDAGESETDYTNRAIRLLKRFARKFQVHLIVVAHPTKMHRNEDGRYPMPSLYDIAGSAAWYNKPDIGIVVHRDGPDETLVKTQKSRYHEVIGKPGIVKMHYAWESRHFVEIERGSVEPAKGKGAKR